MNALNAFDAVNRFLDNCPNPPATFAIATQAWSMHRDPDVFPSPETFLPERWLTVEGVDGEEERIARWVPPSCFGDVY